MTNIQIDSSDAPSTTARRTKTNRPIRRSAGTVAWATAVVLLVGAAVFVAGLGTHATAVAYRKIFPDVGILKTSYPVAVAKDGPRVIYKFQHQRPESWTSLKQISPQAVAAILMSEDSGFFEHHGYEPESIREAIAHNRKPGVKVMRGGSTITQQVVKNLFLSPEKTVTRKVRELLLAVELERRYPKRKILETYLNIAEWGPGVYGIGQASERYFHKPPSELSAHDAAILAFMLPNPIKYQSSIRGGELSDFAQKRVETILERLWKTGKITDEEYTTAPDRDGVRSN